MKALKITSILFVAGIISLAAFPANSTAHYAVVGITVGFFGHVVWWLLWGQHHNFRVWEKWVGTKGIWPPMRYVSGSSQHRHVLYILRRKEGSTKYIVRIMDGAKCIKSVGVNYVDEDDGMFVFQGNYNRNQERFYFSYDVAIDTKTRTTYRLKL